MGFAVVVPVGIQRCLDAVPVQIEDDVLARLHRDCGNFGFAWRDHPRIDIRDKLYRLALRSTR